VILQASSPAGPVTGEPQSGPLRTEKDLGSEFSPGVAGDPTLEVRGQQAAEVGSRWSHTTWKVVSGPEWTRGWRMGVGRPTPGCDS
jgi:hypothetical protein